ncbi:hypothetical protein ACNKHK_03060 [Shigella flexneri]
MGIYHRRGRSGILARWLSCWMASLGTEYAGLACANFTYASWTPSSCRLSPYDAIDTAHRSRAVARVRGFLVGCRKVAVAAGEDDDRIQ